MRAVRSTVAEAIGQGLRVARPYLSQWVLTPVTAIGLISAQTAMAQVCPPASAYATTCNIDQNQNLFNKQVIEDFTGNTSVSGGFGGEYTVNNNGASISPLAPNIFVRLKGSPGTENYDNGKGGQGGRPTINNGGSLSGQIAPSSPYSLGGYGAWDDGGAAFSIYAASVGGAGVNADIDVIGGNDGGNAGNSSEVIVNNSGSAELSMGSSTAGGGAVIYGGTIGGNGGSQDNGTIGNQKGGNGGDSNTVDITNSGSVSFISSNAKDYAWGIAAESIGGNGGKYNGNGGGAGAANSLNPTIIKNSGHVDVNANGSGLTQGVRGLYVITQGGDGFASSDGDDNGGTGGSFDRAQVDNSGAVEVESNSAPKASSVTSLSGGIVAVGQGGNGGPGPSIFSNFTGVRGGSGGTAADSVDVELNNGSSITTTGNYLPGVSALSRGGAGGPGRGDSNGADGGAGGRVHVFMTGNSGIETSGVESYGIIARSYGGAGGGVSVSSGFIDFTPENGGTGGKGGEVDIVTGDSSTGQSGGGIVTHGDYSIGIVGQSMGGIGGATTDSFELIGNSGSNAGAGGASGKVTIDSRSTITTDGASSHGIVAQAIGGGGGIAGQSDGIVAVGGAGGSGVSGGTVDISQSGNLTTSGAGSMGILAQAIGGGGGDGGATNGVAVIGGTGGGGGGGGHSTANVDGYVLKTAGDHAYGVVSQSIGGGGGTGGASFAYDAGPGFSMALAVGGSGGAGGGGSDATVNVSNASIVTGSGSVPEENAHGVVVQSIGGGGGAGGTSVAKAVAIAVPVDDANSFGAAVSFAVGGAGANGGAGGQATANITNARLTTNGASSHGVVVQSIGGGGGIGGSASATSTVIGTGEAVGGTLSVALGGSGGSGNNGGTASLNMVTSAITTQGTASNGIVLQSIGGGGGAGGVGSGTGRTPNVDANVSLSLALGGSGGSGGSGGGVDLTMGEASSITTYGDGAHGALLQSIGGGGGVSQGGQVGLETAASVEDNDVDVDGEINVGGGGSSGGNGGAVDLNSDGTITTHGADADGLVVQSIGGSGGVGGAVGGDSDAARSLPSVNDSGTSYEFNVYVGGTGGAGGNGGAIGTSDDPARLGAFTQTYGDYADAAVLQSIGGGGGAGGESTVASSLSSSELNLSVGGSGGSGGSGGPIVAFLNGSYNNAFNTQGYGAMGLVMQSIGGGGGMAASGSPRAHGTLKLGGNGQAGGDITITNGSWANIETRGDSAYGMVLQSIGGGGGIAMVGSTSSAAHPGSQQFDLMAGNRIGGGNGGNIYVSTGLNLNTYGDRAMGVIAQSIGGGGGIVSTGAADGIGKIALGSEGQGVNTSEAGTVTLNLNGSIKTRGAGAHGIVAQSIGGGGGIGGDTAQPIQFNPSGFVKTSSNVFSQSSGGTVNVSFDGTLQTSGANAHGIVVQSIGGGGGLAGGPQGGFAGSAKGWGVSSSVTVSQTGDLQATGTGSAGIFAQSEGLATYYSGAANVTINGSVQGGSGSGSGVWIADGRDNHLTVKAGGSLSALSGVAVRYDAQDTAEAGAVLNVDNYGKLDGSFLCQNVGDTGCNLYNHEGAIATGALLYDADVKNDGLIVIGKPGGFQTLVVSGDLDLSDSSVIRSDVDFDKMRSARMVVRGDASLAGAVDVLPHALLPNRELPVLTVDGKLQGGLRAVDSPIFDYETRQAGPTTFIHVASADFNAPGMGLGKNQGRIAKYLQKIWDQGGNSALAPLFGQLDQAARRGAGAYRDGMTDLSPGAMAAPAMQSAVNLGHFTSSMMSCPAFTGVDAFTGERNCFWGQATFRATHQNGSHGTAGFDYDTAIYQFGGQREIRPGWFLGGSVALEDSRASGTDGRVQGDGNSGYLGVVLKREAGPWEFSAAAGGGYGSYSMNRGIDIAGYQDTLSSHPDVYGFNIRLRAARTFSSGNVYVKPYVDLDAGVTHVPGYEESGSNPLALSVEGSDHFIAGVSPMVELGGRAELKNGAMLRPYVYAGVSLLSQNEWTSRAQLRGAPSGVGSFETALPFDDVIGNVGAGIEVTQKSGVNFRLQYDGQFSSHAHSNSGSLKVVIPF